MIKLSRKNILVLNSSKDFYKATMILRDPNVLMQALQQHESIQCDLLTCFLLFRFIKESGGSINVTGCNNSFLELECDYGGHKFEVVLKKDACTIDLH